MLYACGANAFLLACILAQTTATTGDPTNVPPTPSVTTPSSGVAIDTDPSPPAVSSPEAGDAPRAVSGPGTSPSAASGPEPQRSPILKRPSAPPERGAPLRRPWYRSGLAGLAGVLGLVFLVSYVLRRYVPAVRALGGGALNVVQRTPLSPKQSIALVRVGRRMVLIGITPDQISSLAIIDDPEECAHLQARAGKDTGRVGADFETALSREADKFGRSATGALEAPIGPSDGADRLRDTKGHLQGMLKKLKGMQVG